MLAKWTCVFRTKTSGGGEEKPAVYQTFFQIIVDFSKKLRIISPCMDTKKDVSIVKCGTMAEICQSRFVVGAKQLKKAIQNGSARRAFLAVNADPALTEPLAAMCQSYGVPCDWVSTMLELGRACGIEVGAAAAAAIE